MINLVLITNNIDNEENTQQEIIQIMRIQCAIINAQYNYNQRLEQLINNEEEFIRYKEKKSLCAVICGTFCQCFCLSNFYTTTRTY